MLDLLPQTQTSSGDDGAPCLGKIARLPAVAAVFGFHGANAEARGVVCVGRRRLQTSLLAAFFVHVRAKCVTKRVRVFRGRGG